MTNLSVMRDLAEVGAAPDPVEYDVLRRAFRLQHFGRCPRCDEYATFFTDPPSGSQTAACRCGWRCTVKSTLIAQESPEDIAVQIVRKESHD